MGTRTRFIGRAAELAAFDGALASARSGHAAFVLVGGEPGMGKTRLLEEFERVARSRGWAVANVRVSAIEGAPAFWPWRQVVRQWLDAEDSPRLRAAITEHGAQLSRIVPELGGTDRPVRVGAEERFTAFSRFGRLLADAAGSGSGPAAGSGGGQGAGMVLLLDDVHWADSDSLALLASVVDQVRDSRLLVVGAFRPRELAEHPSGAELRTLVGRHPSGTSLTLGGFTSAEVEVDLHALLGHRQPPSVVASVAARTRGNPLFIREISRLLEAGLPLDSHLPDLIREVIGQHLDGLPPSCRTALAVAAVAGPDIDPRLLTAVTRTAVTRTAVTRTESSTEAGITETLALLDTAARAGVVVAQADGRFAFVHDLFRETLLHELSITERAGAHLRVATALESTATPRLAEIARHRLAALPLGDAGAASASAHAAGRDAVAHFAFANANDLFERALATAPDELAPARRCELLLDLGTTRYMVGDIEGAVDGCIEGAELADQAGDAEWLGRACLALPEYPNPRWTARVATWSEQALAGLPAGDSAMRSQLLAEQSITLVFVDRSDQQETISRAALSMARRVGDGAALRYALRARQLACSDAPGHAERLVLGGEMLANARRDGDLEGVFWGHMWRFDALVQAGHIDPAIAELDQLEPVVAAMGRPIQLWHVRRGRLAVAIGRGEFASARELGRTPAGRLAALAPASGRAHYWTDLQIARLTGDNRDLPADPPTRTAINPIGYLGDFVNLAPWHLAFRRDAEAAALLKALPEVGSTRIPRFVTMIIEAARCTVAAALGELATAAAAYHALLPHADLHVTNGAGVSFTLGSAHLPLGLAAAALGRPDRALDHLRAAVSANERAGLPPFAAEAHHHLAETLHSLGRPDDREAARQHAGHAAAIADRLGMALLHAKAVDLAERLADRGPDSLTPRQREIAQLVARGRSNREIAAELHISERTAENHLRNIMITLGVRNRVQVANWITGGSAPQGA
ncbi:MAG TPA: BREX system ATP-binding domain-containing protein [Pseudonocardia sp.]|nr:BREX system ATP-binding domain-containing protein [Pseudonocardia sp.]